MVISGHAPACLTRLFAVLHLSQVGVGCVSYESVMAQPVTCIMLIRAHVGVGGGAHLNDC